MSAVHKSESPAATGLNATNQNSHADITPNQQDLAGLIAKFAIAGHTVIRGTAHDFTVTKWGMSRYCVDFAALAAFARQLGVTQ
jgi:hypothetical protein